MNQTCDTRAHHPFPTAFFFHSPLSPLHLPPRRPHPSLCSPLSVITCWWRWLIPGYVSLCARLLPGGPGSGKSLQCERMEERFGLRCVTLGELLCAELQSHSDRGRHLQDILERGEQLPEVSVTFYQANKNMEISCVSQPVFAGWWYWLTGVEVLSFKMY